MQQNHDVFYCPEGCARSLTNVPYAKGALSTGYESGLNGLRSLTPVDDSRRMRGVRPHPLNLFRESADSFPHRAKPGWMRLP